IEEGELIIPFDPGTLVLVPDAEVDRDVVGDLPIVLEVRRDVLLRRTKPRVAGDLTAGRRAQEKRREAEAGGARRGGRIRPLRERGAKDVLTGRVLRAEHVESHARRL